MRLVQRRKGWGRYVRDRLEHCLAECLTVVVPLKGLNEGASTMPTHRMSQDSRTVDARVQNIPLCFAKNNAQER